MVTTAQDTTIAPALTAPSIIINSAALLKTVQGAALLAAAHPVVPILENVLLRLEPAKTKYSTARTLRVSSSDLETHFVSAPLPVECAVNMPATAVCAPAKQLAALLKALPAQPLQLEMEVVDNAYSAFLHLRGTVPCSLLADGQGAISYRLAGERDNDFPLPKPAETLFRALVTVPAQLLLAGLAATLPVVSTDELRPAMTGVLLRLEKNRLTMVATDGHRLARYQREDQHTFQGLVGQSLIIPRRAALLLSKLLDRRETVELRVFSQQLHVRLKAGELLIRLIDERYPDYENILPQGQPYQLTAHRLELLAGLKRVDLVSNRITRQIELHLHAENECALVAQDLDYEHHATERISGTYEGNPVHIGFNARFLQGFLAAAPWQNVRLSLDHPNRAVLLESADADDGLLLLLMPLMLNHI